MKIHKFDPAEISGIIFDLDGVITNTASIHSVAWQKSFDTHLKEISKKKFIKSDYLNYIDGKPRLNGIQDYLNSRKIKITKLLVDTISREKNYLFQSLIKINEIETFNDSIKLLKEIKKQKIKVAVASSSKNCRLILKKTKLLRIFDFIIDGNDLEKRKIKGKPNPDIFLIAIKKLKLNKHKTLIFEDSSSGIISAANSGAKFIIGVARSSNNKELMKAGANIVVNSIDQIRINK